MDTLWHRFQELPSTNGWAKEQIQHLDPHALHVIVAESQTKGYGQWGRSWVAQPGASLTASLAFFSPQLPLHVGGLSLALLQGVIQHLTSLGVKISIKWPNDLYLGQKKVGGILGEIVTLDHSYGVIIGLGLNLTLPESTLEEVSQPATSLASLYPDIDWKASSLLSEWVKSCHPIILNWVQRQALPSLHSLNQHLLWKGEYVVVHQRDKRLHGKLIGIAPEGSLNLLTEQGETLISSGTLRLS